MSVSQTVFVCLAAAVTAAPQGREYYEEQPRIKILAQKFIIDEEGNYEYGYEQDNGQRVRKLQDKLHSADDVNRFAAINRKEKSEYERPEYETRI